MSEEPTIWVLSPVPASGAAEGTLGTSQSVLFRNRIDLKAFAASLREFSQAIGGSLEDLEQLGHEFSLTEVELSALAGADGSLTLLGADLGGRLEGSVKLVFKRQLPGTEA